MKKAIKSEPEKSNLFAKKEEEEEEEVELVRHGDLIVLEHIM